MKKLYVKICFRDIDVYYEKTNNELRVLFEQGPKKLVLDICGNIKKCCGFDSSEVDYCKLFLSRNSELIKELAEEY